MTIPSKAKGDGMSEHSIEELERQVEQARSKHRQAALEKMAAEKRLHDRRCLESGYMFKVVTGKRHKILVQDVQFSGRGTAFAVSGFKIKKDGTPGNRIGTVWLADLVAASPYDAPHPHTSKPVEVTA